MIKTVQDSLAVAADDPKHDEAIEKIRNITKDWVATYRKGGNYQGRPSYGCAQLQPCRDWGRLVGSWIAAEMWMGGLLASTSALGRGGWNAPAQARPPGAAACC